MWLFPHMFNKLTGRRTPVISLGGAPEKKWTMPPSSLRPLKAALAPTPCGSAPDFLSWGGGGGGARKSGHLLHPNLPNTTWGQALPTPSPTAYPCGRSCLWPLLSPWGNEKKLHPLSTCIHSWGRPCGTLTSNKTSAAAPHS